MRRRRRLLSFVVHVVLPVALGAAIYVGWRSTDLLVFRWIDAVGAGGLVVRPGYPLPGWVLYSLPDGCWVYAYTSWMLLIWGRTVPWVLTGVVLAVVAELGQLVGVVPGTYDTVDMVFYVGAFLLAEAVHEKAPQVDGGVSLHDAIRFRKR